MNALVKKTLRKAFGGGRDVPQAALDDLLELCRLADDATLTTQAEALSAAAALDLPVDVGGVKLWRLSMGACEWLAQIERDWFAGDSRMMDKAVVWACAHARDVDAFAGMGGRTATAFRLGVWARRQSASWEALTETVRALLPKQKRGAVVDGADGGEDREYLGAVLESLLANYGQTAEHWLWEVPQELIVSLLSESSARADIANGEEVASARQLAAHKRFADAANAFSVKWGANA